MVAFFPWWDIRESVRFDELSLLPYKAERKPLGPGQGQELIDAVIGRYYSQDTPVYSATLMQLKSHGLLDDLTDDERQDAFLYADLVAFVGLAQRTFFGFGMYYCNTDNFMFRIQAFQHHPGSIAVTTRRRDGNVRTLVEGSSYKVQMPEHVDPQYALPFDSPLMSALLKAMSSPLRERLVESIRSFNRANTDSSQETQQGEVNKMMGAIERILDQRSSNVGALAKAFLETFVPKKCILGKARENMPERQQTMHLREIWIRDFYMIRHPLSHGRQQPNMSHLWPAQESLLLGAFAFPLLVKVLLSKSGLYTLTEQDKTGTDVFERLLTVNLLATPGDQKSSMDHMWDRVMKEFLMEQLRDEIAEEMENMSCE